MCGTSAGSFPAGCAFSWAFQFSPGRRCELKYILLFQAFAMLLMQSLFPDGLSQSVEHSVSESIVGQEVVTLAPFVEACDGYEARHVGMPVQISERRLYERFESCGTFVDEYRASGPFRAVGCRGTVGGCDVAGRGVPSGSDCWDVGNLMCLVTFIPDFERHIGRRDAIVGQFDLFGLIAASDPVQRIV